MGKPGTDDLADRLQQWREQGVRRIAGVDEVGRGPLVGPVVAAAVILPEGFDATGIADSKKLSASRREALAARLLRQAQVGLAYVPAPEIDRLNIHGATLLAMARAIAALSQPPEAVLIDGKFVPGGLGCPGLAVIGGDARVAAIGAASIVAKVARDRLMAAADRHYPGYGFAGHAGYPTKAHRAALAERGLCPLHRLSYGPCRDLA